MGVIRFSLDPDRQKGQTFSSDDYIYRTDPEWKLILDNLPEGRIEVFYGGKSSMDEMKITKNYGDDGADIPADYVKRYSTIYAGEKVSNEFVSHISLKRKFGGVC